MDAVPLAFCSSVAATLQSPSSIEKGFSSGIWRSAAVDEGNKRLNWSLYFNYTKGIGWSYGLLHGDDSMTFRELKKLKRRDLRIRGVLLYEYPYANKTSFEEILEIANYTLPCVNMAVHNVHDTMECPQEDLLKLLSIYKNSAFKHISTSANDSPVLDFILPHLRSAFLKDLEVYGAVCSPSLKEAVRDAALNKEWGNLCFAVENAEFDTDFLEALLQKPITQRQSYHFNCSFEKSALNDFMRRLRTFITTGLEWERPDGVTIAVRRGHRNLLSVTFWPPFKFKIFTSITLLADWNKV